MNQFNEFSGLFEEYTEVEVNGFQGAKAPHTTATVVKMDIPANKPIPDQSEARNAAETARERGKRLFAEHMPKDCKAVIIAELKKDESDSMTDYFHGSTQRTVILAFSNHERDVFSELRKAATRYEETKHLEHDHYSVRVFINENFYSNGSYYRKGEYSHWHQKLEPKEEFTSDRAARDYIAAQEKPYSISFEENKVEFIFDVTVKCLEQREKYSGGHGYYLATGSYSGWQIRKRRLAQGYMDSLYAAAGTEGGFFAAQVNKQTEMPGKTESNTPQAPATGITVIESYSDKAFALIGEGTAAIKDQLLGLNGGYNRNLKCGPGWIFSKKRREAVRELIGQ
jgi:hypothetical protein